MGSIVVSSEGDASSAIFNPAILAETRNYSVTGTYSARWSLEGFIEYSAGFSIPTKYFSMAGGWQERAVLDVYGERTISLSIGRKVIPGVNVGFAGKIFIESAPGAELWAEPLYKGSQTAFSADIGVIYRLVNNLTLGLVARNFTEPSIKMIPISEKGEAIGRQFAFGGTCKIANRVLFSVDLVSKEGTLEKWQLRAGTEIDFFDALKVRAGAKGFTPALGVGVYRKHWAFDYGISFHRQLGNIYRTTVSLKY